MTVRTGAFDAVISSNGKGLIVYIPITTQRKLSLAPGDIIAVKVKVGSVK